MKAVVQEWKCSCSSSLGRQTAGRPSWQELGQKVPGRPRLPPPILPHCGQYGPGGKHGLQSHRVWVHTSVLPFAGWLYYVGQSANLSSLRSLSTKWGMMKSTSLGLMTWMYSLIQKQLNVALLNPGKPPGTLAGVITILLGHPIIWGYVALISYFRCKI